MSKQPDKELEAAMHKLFFDQSMQWPVDSSEVRWNFQEVLKLVTEAQLQLIDELMMQTKLVLYVADGVNKKIYSETPYQAIPIEVLQQYKANLSGKGE